MPTSKIKRKGIWKDVTCTYNLKFNNSEVSIPVKVDVYGEDYQKYMYYMFMYSEKESPAGVLKLLNLPIC